MSPIATVLETDRLRMQEARLARALRVLEGRMAELRRSGRPVPAPLSNAVTGFREDLQSTRVQVLSTAD